MAPRKIKLREQEEGAQEIEQDMFSQRKRPEVGRFLLQVDRQTKSSYAQGEAAERAAMLIKKDHPILQVAVYDTVESQHKIIEVPTPEKI